ncbi:MarR family winged helix-turn-helix transcriptional regulator [Gryllotalpicola ginsengisoli]|uniref:MarR family winged helix-turn-helix transcriptional regulator n=1 Tax=Gryllotalpicola ginsengisoli TaxID=444608 RepID=UPI0003B487BA|nr:MarR family transcriptional regulator [Gryllotalpicola ginsengisoli]
MTSPDPDALAAELFGSLRQLVLSLRQPRAQGGLSASEMAALMRIKRAGEATSGAIARLEGISPQAMGVTVAALEARGLIDRTKDPDDGRRMLLRLTDAGEAVFRERQDARTETIVALLAERFTQDELAVLGQAAPLLQRLADAL